MARIKKSGFIVAAAAAALFAAGTVATVSTSAIADDGVKCVGANACKGQSACKSANSACGGQNSCKGQGFTVMPDAAACEAAGGTVG